MQLTFPVYLLKGLFAITAFHFYGGGLTGSPLNYRVMYHFKVTVFRLPGLFISVTLRREGSIAIIFLCFKTRQNTQKKSKTSNCFSLLKLTFSSIEYASLSISVVDYIFSQVKSQMTEDEISNEMTVLDIQLKDLEKKGVKLEEMLRDEMELG